LTERKRNGLGGLLVFVLWLALFLFFGYCLFFGSLCVWVGIRNRHLDGFWMPVAVGTLSILLVLWLLFSIVRLLYRRNRARASAQGLYDF